jgi:hypothetical protein
MQTYAELSDAVACDSTVAVMVCANEDCTDVEFIALKPRADEAALANLKERWPGRGLRSIGVLGLKGTAPLCVFKVPLDPDKINELARAFIAYINSLLFPAFTERMTIAELHRMAALPDNRLPN